MLWGFTVVDHDNNRVTDLCKVSAHSVVVVNIANDPAAAVVIHHQAFSGGGWRQDSTPNTAATNRDLDVHATHLSGAGRHGAVNF